MNMADIEPVHENDIFLLLIKLIFRTHRPYLNGVSTTSGSNKHTIQNESIPYVRHINKCELCLLGENVRIHTLTQSCEIIVWCARHIQFQLPLHPLLSISLAFAQLLLRLLAAAFLTHTVCQSIKLYSDYCYYSAMVRLFDV